MSAIMNPPDDGGQEERDIQDATFHLMEIELDATKQTEEYQRETLLQACDSLPYWTGCESWLMPGLMSTPEYRKWLTGTIDKLVFHAHLSPAEKCVFQLAERFNWEVKSIHGCVDGSRLLTRFIVKRTRFGSLYVHIFHRSDEDRELHDHPWAFITLPLWRGYVEETERPVRRSFIGWLASLYWEGPRHTKRIKRRRWPLIPLFRRASFAHRVETVGHRPGITLIWTFPRSREWGFWKDGHWTQWEAWGRSKGCVD